VQDWIECCVTIPLGPARNPATALDEKEVIMNNGTAELYIVGFYLLLVS
jgi:hypothetical protein